MTSTSFALGNMEVIMEDVSFPTLETQEVARVSTPVSALKIKCKKCRCTPTGCVCESCEIA